MAFPGLRASWVAVASASLLLACIGQGPSSESSGSSGLETVGDGFDEGLDEGFDSGLDGGFGGCSQYLQACASDPACVCYLECVEQTFELRGDAEQLCLTRCNLAQEPYWFTEFLLCIQAEIPDGFDTGQDTGRDTGQDTVP